MTIKQTLGTILLTSAIGLAGCSPNNHIEGKVVSECGTLASQYKKFGNESVKLGISTYGLKVETPQGVYTIEVDVSDQSGSSGPHTAYTLAAAIEEGTIVRFPLQYGGKDLFSADRFG